MKDFLSIIVPVFDESAKIQNGELEKLIVALERLIPSWELVIVDDGSTDSSAEMVGKLSDRDKRVHLLREPHCGKGFALLAGMRAARGEIVLFTDLDQATPIDEIIHLLPWFQRGYDIVYGTRGIRRKQAPMSRKCISSGYVFLRRLIVGSLSSVDTQCGFKAFRRKSLQDIMKHLYLYHYEKRLPLHGRRVTPGFDVEILLVARQRGYLAKGVKVNWSYHHCRGLNLYTEAWQGLKDLCRLRSALTTGKYSAKE